MAMGESSWPFSFLSKVSTNMNSPFEEINDIAFLPFYTDAFSVETKGGKKTTLHVCLFTDMTEQPLSEGAFETERKAVSLVCKEEDWPWVKDNLARGDTIVDAKTLRKYSVTEVEDDPAIGKIVHAREC